ncbi:phosphoribosylformylglycinamidine cyclo-ligase [Halomarina rubra]|uniref:Phosphoribosylformylglycinamidine cyclo-ligase n=1 Tax=Halomarina rubra TaxID=2071873 RepID=A0ABD6AZU3_9EURY|nr:phosphoribosylformylglycinamidine cyclo-ligase [Halomarina rubra]
MTEDADTSESPADDERMTYSESGVDIADSEAATAALVGAIGETAGDYAGLVDLGDRYLALATDGVGTKLLVAEALGDYSTIGVDCIAMNVNDLVAAGVTPVAFVDYLAVDVPDDDTAEQVGRGLAAGAAEAGIELVGGETAVLPDVVTGLDLAGACAGIAEKGDLLPGAAESGDALVGVPSSGIHSNGLTLAREAATADHDYTDPFPLDESKTVGEVLLEPTRIYTDLLDALHDCDAHAAAHVTGGGWTNLTRMGDHHYEVTDAFDPQPVFEFVQTAGNVADEEMYRTFNMGTGFVVSLAPAEADRFVEQVESARRIGTVEDGDGTVSIRGLTLS